MKSISNAARSIINWLYLSCFMVVAMAVIGAVTRLTESGLSIVEWKPVQDMLPPLSSQEWQRLFEIYQQTPEYQQINAGMSLEDFKAIYFWEWLHRLWGRLIGIVYALPLLFFWVKGMIPQGYKLRLLIGLILGGLQGAMGWYMVESGLVDRPDVSHYRLAVHLSLAFIIFGYLWWLILDLKKAAPKIAYTFCKLRHGLIALLFLFATIIWGAFTAGLDAGKIYNTWPLMSGGVFPPEDFASHAALLEQHAWVQFMHRWLAALTLFFTLTFAWRMKSLWLAGLMTLQFVLGIATLLSVLWIPLAAAHQFTALMVFAALLYNLHRLWKSKKERL